MSSLTTLARPYAKAAFEVARGQDDLSGWGAALDAAAAAVADDGLAAWLASPDLDRDKAVAIIGEAAGSPGDAFNRFLGAMADNDRLSVLGEVAGLYGELRQSAENRLDVRVVSAVALDEDQAGRMEAALAKRFDCEIELHNEIDASVLGGAVIYAGDQVIDGSLKGRLVNLQGSLS